MARLGRVAQAAGALTIILVCTAGANAQITDKPPFWAYTYNPPDFKPPPDDGQPRHVPDSTASYTVPQTRDRFLASDWHPGDHPAMPAVVASGRQPDVYACGFCHRASGTGGPENADIAGLPVAYFIQQMQDYRSGKRSTALPDRIPQAWMISAAKAANDDEIKAAAEYFAAIKPKKLVDVVETETVPKPTVAGWFFVTKGDEREPIGMRIIETPADVGRFVNRDARVRFTAYVPPGSIAAGRGAGREAGDRLRRLPRREANRHRRRAGHRRALADLHLSPALRIPARLPRWAGEQADDRRGQRAPRGRLFGTCRLSRHAGAVKRPTVTR